MQVSSQVGSFWKQMKDVGTKVWLTELQILGSM